MFFKALVQVEGHRIVVFRQIQKQAGIDIRHIRVVRTDVDQIRQIDARRQARLDHIRIGRRIDHFHFQHHIGALERFLPPGHVGKVREERSAIGRQHRNGDRLFVDGRGAVIGQRATGNHQQAQSQANPFFHHKG